MLWVMGGGDSVRLKDPTIPSELQTLVFRDRKAASPGRCWAATLVPSCHDTCAPLHGLTELQAAARGWEKLPTPPVAAPRTCFPEFRHEGQASHT